MAAEPSSIPVDAAHVQAGGGQSTEPPLVKEVERVGASILPYIKALADGSRPLDAAQVKEIHVFRGGPASIGEGEKPDIKTLLIYLTSKAGNSQAPLPEFDLTRPLPEYFVSSSHNTYLTGNQLYGEASTESYRNVLLRGCRCIEIDVWDGEDHKESEEEHEGEKHGIRSRISSAIKRHSGVPPTGTEGEGLAKTTSNVSDTLTPTSSRRSEPRVLHGHTLTKEVSFREVCAAIKETAFVNSDLPVIVSLEIHAGPTQQELMIEIMKQSWGSMLILPPEKEPSVLPSPADLRRKILIKAKAAAKPNAAVAATKAPSARSAGIEDSSDSEPTPHTEAKSRKPVKKSKIIDAISRMGVYTKGYHFSKLDSPEALIPSHVFSLSEKKMVEVHESFGPALFSHNMKYFMRAYPSATRVSSSNLDPSIFWRKFGAQLVALNWQRIDAGMMLNEGQFAGSGGWILKPEEYREGATNAGIAVEAKPRVVPCKAFNLQIEILAAQDLPLKHEYKLDRTYPYVKCQIHAGSPQERIGASEDGNVKNQEIKHKQRTKASKGADPDFGGEVLRFSRISTVEALSFVRFKVQNDTYGRDRLLAWACIRLDRLRAGYRLIHLLDAKGFESRAVLFVNVRKEVLA